MKLTIIGAGAIGGTIGAHMTRAGHDITLCDADESHVSAIRTHGLTIEGPVENFVVEVNAITPDQLPSSLDHVAIAVKSHHTQSAAEALRGRITPHGYLVSFQNGLTAEALAEVVGWDRLLVSFVNFGADVMAPGVIMQGNIGTFRIGEPQKNEVTQRVLDLCDAVPYAVPTDNIMGYLWGKEAYGAMLYGGAVSDLSIADHLEDPRWRPLMLAIAREVLAQAPVRVEAFDGFDPNDLEGSLTRLVEFNRNSAKSHSGIYRDLMVRKRKTEVDDLLRDLAGPLTTHIGRLIQAIERGERTCEVANLELLDTYRRVHEADPRLSAIETLNDAPLRSLTGPLHGIQIAVKDMIAVKGVTKSNGNPNDRAHPTETHDAPVVRALREAAADIFATTTLLEYAAGAPHPEIADARNPHDLTKTAGGSSGGSAAIVASGIAEVALGTDTGGSVRIPAHYCGIPSFLPTSGVLPTEGITPLSPTFDRVGILGSTMAKIRQVFEVLSPTSMTQAQASPKLCLGILVDQIEQCDQSVLPAIQRGVQRLHHGGYEILTISTDALVDLDQVFDPILMYEFFEVHQQQFLTDPTYFGPQTARLLAQASTVTKTSYEQAKGRLPELIAQAVSLFGENIALVGPVAPYVAPAENPPMDTTEGDREGMFTRAYNVIGCPVATIALEVDRGELPVGLQLAMARGQDRELLQLAQDLTNVLSPTTSPNDH